MDNNILLVGGNAYRIPKNLKSVTSIPGWAEAYLESASKRPAAQRYTQSPTAFRCVNIRANALSAIPWHIIKKGDKDKITVENTDIEKVLWEVNPEMNWVDLIRATEADLNVYGEGYWLNIGKGNITNLKRINPAIIEPLSEGAGIIGFRLKPAKGRKEVEYSLEEIIYFKTYHPGDDIRGLSPLDVVANSIDLEIKTTVYAESFFDNFALPGIILSSEQDISQADAEKTVNWFKRKFGGTKNKHKVGVVGRGMKPDIVGYPVKDLALHELRAEARRDICAALGVPPAIAGAWEAANYASSVEQRESLYEDTIIPRAVYIAEVLNASLLPRFDEDLVFDWEFNKLDIMQPDRLQEAERAKMLSESGVVKPLALALELGYEEKDAGEGPTERRIIDQENMDGQAPPEVKSNFQEDIGKWEKKALNSYVKKNNGQVEFESTNIPDAVYLVVHDKLGKAKSKDDIRNIFSPFKEIGV